MSKEKQIEERNELVELLEDIGHDWDAYIDKCQENEELPQISYNDFHADAILEAGYRKQGEGEWVQHGNWAGNIEYKCTACKETTFHAQYYAYCPNCGAKMKGGEGK